MIYSAFKRTTRMRRQLNRGKFERDYGFLKTWLVRGTEFEGHGVLTAYAAKEKRRRRAARKVAHESRRRNRA